MILKIKERKKKKLKILLTNIESKSFAVWLWCCCGRDLSCCRLILAVRLAVPSVWILLNEFISNNKKKKNLSRRDILSIHTSCNDRLPNSNLRWHLQYLPLTVAKWSEFLYNTLKQVGKSCVGWSKMCLGERVENLLYHRMFFLMLLLFFSFFYIWMFFQPHLQFITAFFFFF